MSKECFPKEYFFLKEKYFLKFLESAKRARLPEKSKPRHKGKTSNFPNEENNEKEV